MLKNYEILGLSSNGTVVIQWYKRGRDPLILDTFDTPEEYLIKDTLTQQERERLVRRVRVEGF